MTPTDLKSELAQHRDTYEAALRAGQTATWSCDQRTRDVWSIPYEPLSRVKYKREANFEVSPSGWGGTTWASRLILATLN